MFKPIDKKVTGENIKRLIKNAGYEVTDIVDYLQLSCPQTVYKWYKGERLPSLEYLYALSKLLNVHMEDFIVLEGEVIEAQRRALSICQRRKRLLEYYKRIYGEKMTEEQQDMLNQLMDKKSDYIVKLPSGQKFNNILIEIN